MSGYYGIEVHASSSSLSHHGIKGQKWGVRRYQNEDGSLTPEGRKRYGSSESSEGSSSSNGIASKLLDKTVKPKKNQSISPAEDALNKASQVNQETTNLVRNAHNIRANKKSKQNISQMSDEELRAAINRLNMEKQYKQLTAEDTSAGYERVMAVLDTTGSVLAIGASVVGIASGIHALRKH